MRLRGGGTIGAGTVLEADEEIRVGRGTQKFTATPTIGPAVRCRCTTRRAAAILTWEGWGGWGGLGWTVQVLLFFLAAVLVRLVTGIASIANARGSLILAFGTPAIFAGLGYGVVTIFRPRPIAHSCPANSPACFYHPLIGAIGPWIFLGLLAGIWLAYATAADLAGSPQRGPGWAEYAIVLPVMSAVIVWALIFSHQQAGGGYVGLAGLFVVAACLTALLRLLLGAGPVRRKLPGALPRLGMVRRTGAAAQP